MSTATGCPLPLCSGPADRHIEVLVDRSREGTWKVEDWCHEPWPTRLFARRYYGDDLDRALASAERAKHAHSIPVVVRHLSAVQNELGRRAEP